MRITRVKEPYACTGLATLVGMKEMFRQKFRLKCILCDDVDGLGVKGDIITTSEVQSIDFVRKYAITKSGNLYYWE